MNYREFNESLDAFIFKFRNAAKTPTEEALEKGIELVRNDPEGFAKHFSQIFVARPRIETLYRANVEMLRGAACDQYPAISTYDADASLSSLHANLWEYRGPASSAAFLKWATAWIKRQAARLEAFHRLQSEHSKVVYDGVWDVVNANRDLVFSDLTITIQQIMSTVWLRVWEEIDSLIAPDQPAKVSTRLWDFGYWGGRGWKTDQLRLRSDQKEQSDADHKPERALRPSLAAIEAVPAPEVPEPDFSEQELEPVRTVCDAEPEVSNVPTPPAGHYRALFCSKCGGMETVRAIEDDRARLACGHVRSTDWLPAAKDAWSAEQARLRTENKVRRMEKRAA